MRYSVDAEGTLLAERRILRDRQSTEANKVVLLRDVAGVSFKYLDYANAFDTWQQKDSLPSAVQVNMTKGHKHLEPFALGLVLCTRVIAIGAVSGFWSCKNA